MKLLKIDKQREKLKLKEKEEYFIIAFEKTCFSKSKQKEICW